MTNYHDLLDLVRVLKSKGLEKHLEDMTAQTDKMAAHEAAAKQKVLELEALQASIHGDLKSRGEQQDAKAQETQAAAEKILKANQDKQASLDRHAEQMTKQADELARRLAELDAVSNSQTAREQDLNIREHELAKREARLKVATENLHMQVIGGNPGGNAIHN